MQGYIVAIRHGGHCCGMTHIYNFPPFPTHACPAREILTAERFTEQVKLSPHTRSHINDTRPAETAEARLRALVTLIPSPVPTSGQTYTCRSSGILEIVLTSYNGEGVAVNWRPLLTELGFKEVNSHLNSNSGRTLHVLHKNTGIGAQ